MHSSRILPSFVALAAYFATTNALVPLWSRCGGEGWTGETECVEGAYCKVLNQWWSSCERVPVTECTTFGPYIDPNSQTDGLNSFAVRRGKYVGTAGDWVYEDVMNCTWAQIASDPSEFGSITPGNSQKWDTTEPTQGTFNFANADSFVAWGLKYNKKIRGHTLVWHSQLPSWVTSGSWNATTLQAVLENHVTTVAAHFKGKMFHWDVVNEPFNEDGTFRNSIFYQILGESYIDIAFRAAAAADPKAKLFLNDYNVEGINAKSTALLNLFKRLKAAGVPIHGIGVQGHLISGSVPTDIEQNFNRMTAAGAEIAITELDIRMQVPPANQTAAYEQQAREYETVTKACKVTGRCVGITLWNFTDKNSWVPSVFTGQGDALPWDRNFVKKPAYYAMARTLKP
ncbi:Exoglucanase [Dactylella cylindrospora]|nr:Exoglucanase [Dactylella cylindrospora]